MRANATTSANRVGGAGAKHPSKGRIDNPYPVAHIRKRRLGLAWRPHLTRIAHQPLGEIRFAVFSWLAATMTC